MAQFETDDDPAGWAEHPVSRDVIRRSISQRPNTAAVALDLLRTINLEEPALGLIQESLAYGLLQGSREHADWLSDRKQADAPRKTGQVQVTRTGQAIDIVLDRAHANNAIDRAMRDALHEAFTVAVLDAQVSCVRLRGVGKAFCIGADLDEFGTTRDPSTAHQIRMQTLPALVINECAHKFDTHVQGACAGSGLEMAAFARMLTASPNAWFQLPELQMGLIPGAGGCVSVARRIGRKRAALMILSGRRISAQTALRWGLIDAIVDDDPFGNSQPHVTG
jgi:enoyl-CoA hydratase/carnithine racemase